MTIIPTNLRTHIPGAKHKNVSHPRIEKPLLPEVTARRPIRLPFQKDERSHFLEKVLSRSRVLIVEGISGSGKDTFQKYLKKNLKGREVYDYSEGEVLLSWNHLQIKDIFNLQVKLMKLFMVYVKEVIRSEENAVFLLNRFHLSTYVMAIIKQPDLEAEYFETINALRALPVHVFILRLAENEIEKRTAHPERSAVWQKFQIQIAQTQGFRNKVERYIWQQKLMLDEAERQKIPYTVLRYPSVSGSRAKWIPLSNSGTMLRGDVRVSSVGAKNSQRKKRLPHTLEVN